MMGELKKKKPQTPKQNTTISEWGRPFESTIQTSEVIKEKADKSAWQGNQ